MRASELATILEGLRTEEAEMNELKKMWFTRDGRITRQDVLQYFLLPVVVYTVFFQGVLFVGTAAGIPQDAFLPLVLVYAVGGLVLCAASLSMYTKRLHDRNKSGWWLLLLLIPLLGVLWLLVEVYFLPGTPGPNRFGPAPSGNGEKEVW